MNKKTVISATHNTILKLKVSAKKKENIRGKLAITARQIAVTAKEKESIKGKLEVTARRLAVIAKEKESVRRKLAVTAETLRLKAKQLAMTAREKENIRGKLEITAETLRLKAKQLAVTAKEKESIKGKLEVTAERLATTAKEKEGVRRKLVVTAERLAVIAKEKESVRRKLAVTAETLRLKAKQLAVTAKEKESIKDKLEVTAKQLATTAKEKEGVRRKLEITAETLRLKAKQLAVTAKEKESVRSKLVVTAKKLAVTAKEIESANKELHSLDLAKDEFVSIASHQLRTPLTAIKGYAGMLLDGDPGPINDKQREYLGEMRHANDRMIDLITALLNVSRVDLGVFSVEPEPVNVEEIARGVLKEMEVKIKDKKLRIETSFEKGLPLLSADPKITRMIFQNLLSNAVKYTPTEGTISLDIKEESSFVHISVADTGYGIPEGVQSKIFTKMFRADNARAKDPDGTGLGLYIIRATIEQIGGKIWFKSKENKGTTFYVSIPLKGMKKRESAKSLQ